MPRLSQAQQRRLTDRGLVLGFRPENSTWADRIKIVKPLGVPGNCAPHIQNSVHLWPTSLRSIREAMESDAPGLDIGYSQEENQWFVFMVQFGGTNPLDFRHYFEREEDAVDDVLDYFFGSYERMRPLAEFYADWKAERAEIQAKLEDYQSKTRRPSARQQKRLTDRGLLLRPYSREHSMSNWIMVLKPVGLPGNYDASEGRMNFGDYEIEAPEVYVYFRPDIGKWVSRMMHYGGGSSSHDFQYEWETDKKAIDDILDYFFGDPARMEETFSGRAQILSRSAEAAALTAKPRVDRSR